MSHNKSIRAAFFIFLALVAAALFAAQNGSVPAPAVAPVTVPEDYVCPMDPDIRSAVPGKCPRCGMKLVLGIPDPIEYPLELKLTPRVPAVNAPVELTFKVQDPKNGAQVNKFEIVHEKLFHMFIVSQDLQYFVHDHPVLQPDASFQYEARIPEPGMYRVLGDFYPTGGTPQLIAKTIFVPGGVLKTAVLTPDLSPKHTENLDVQLVTDPPHPIAGFKTLLFFQLKPADGLEKYIGAWGHMLAASDDLIDLIHTHPFIANGGPKIQFNLIFPRARNYRVWVQFQRKGVVNTAVFTVPVSELK